MFNAMGFFYPGDALKEAPDPIMLTFWILTKKPRFAGVRSVTFVVGNAHKIQASLLAPATTISATIANEFTEADKGLYSSSLVALGLILFLITFIVLALAQLLLRRLQHRYGGGHA